MTGFFLWRPTGAQFFVPRGCEWGKQLEREGYEWVEPSHDDGRIRALEQMETEA